MLPANWIVELNDKDISNQVADISNLSAELDLDNPFVFNTSEARLLVNYPLPEDLRYKANVSIFVGGTLKYKGGILSIDKDLKNRIADVIVSDITQDMRNKPLDNFGLSKRVRLSKAADTESGEYPFTEVLSPVSDNSVIGGTSGRDSYDTDILEFADDADNDDPVYFGEIIDSKIETIAWEDGYIYKTTQTLDSLSIRINCHVSKKSFVACRYTTTPPNPDPINLTTHGDSLFTGNPDSDNNIDVENTITNPQAGTYFWFYPESDIEVSNRRLRLGFGAGAIEGIRVVDSFATEGNLDALNVSYDEETLRSEGGPLEYNPDVTLKAPYRHKTPQFLIEKILNHYGIETNYRINLDYYTLDKHYFSSNGRVGYDIESNFKDGVDSPNAEGVETRIFWTGRVTDYLVDNNKFYFLYSSRINDPKARSKIIEYNPLGDTYKVLFEKDSHLECWKFAKVPGQDIFYILGTTLSSVLVDFPTLGAYDPTENNPETVIEKIENGVSSVYISSGHTFRPVVGMYYQLGFPIDGRNNNVRRGILPDTRKSFIFHNNNLYYLYANRNNFGVAKATAFNEATAFVSFPQDDYFNHLGADFTIKNDVMYIGAIFQSKSRSTREIYKKSLV